MTGPTRWLHWAFCCLFVWVLGCQTEPATPPAPSTPEPQPPLRVLVVDRERWGAEIERRWNADAQTPIEVEFVAATEFSATRLEGFDVVIYSSEWAPALANAGAILALDERRFDSEDWNAKDVLPLESGTRVRWGKEIIGVSLGHATWVLAYRESRVASLETEIPQSWEELDKWLGKLVARRESSGSSAAVLGIPMVGNDVAEVLLARVGPSVRHRGAFSPFFDLGQARPSLSTEPFVSALDWLRSAAISSSELTSTECWKALRNGELDVAILPVPIRGEEIDGESLDGDRTVEPVDLTRGLADVRFAPLPGSGRVFVNGSGWRDRGPDEAHSVPYLGSRGTIASISKSSRRAGAAWGFLQWLGSSRAQSLWANVASEAFPTRYSSLSSLERWLPEGLSDAAIDDVIEIVRAAQGEMVTMSPLRVPTGGVFLEALAEAAREVRAGVAARQAMETASRKWESEIERLGQGPFLSQNEKGMGL